MTRGPAITLEVCCRRDPSQRAVVRNSVDLAVGAMAAAEAGGAAAAAGTKATLNWTIPIDSNTTDVHDSADPNTIRRKK
jgi:hypothetical protein